jgi:predicted RNA-binding Zn-ribbon protein involved in translation (DUF1610 family)
MMLDQQSRSMRKRHRVRLEYVPTGVGFAVGVAWLFVVGRGTQWLEDATGFDLLPWILELPMPLNLVLGFLLGCGGAFGAGIATAILLARRRTMRLIAFHRDLPACVYCDYDLSGTHLTEQGLYVCPECGHVSIRMEARFDWIRTIRPTMP